MDTLRSELTRCGFDFENGKIYYSEIEDGGYCPGWSKGRPAILIENNNPILDMEYYPGHGSPQMPRFIAYDDRCVYFPVQYDGASWAEAVFLNPIKYCSGEEQTPYMGG